MYPSVPGMPSTLTRQWDAFPGILCLSPASRPLIAHDDKPACEENSVWTRSIFLRVIVSDQMAYLIDHTG